VARKPVTDQDLINQVVEARCSALEAKVNFLWEMVEFLNANPNYRVGDYLQENHDRVAQIDLGGENCQ
jgi:hypothetical protein